VGVFLRGAGFRVPIASSIRVEKNERYFGAGKRVRPGRWVFIRQAAATASLVSCAIFPVILCSGVGKRTAEIRTADLPQANAFPLISESPGWTDVPNATLQSVCPPNTADYAFSNRCSGIVRAWSGGVADTKRNRLVVWGGGHNDYFGNELYAFDLATLKLSRLNDPSVPTPLCQGMYADGRPAARHTYGGIAYVEHLDKMFVFGGYTACPSGGAQGDTWLLDFATLASGGGNPWTRQDPTHGGKPDGSAGVSAAVYDPSTKLVFVVTTRDGLWSYNADSNTYRKLNNSPMTTHASGVLDPARHTLLIFGDGRASRVSIAPGSNYASKPLKADGCAELLSEPSPGLAYDPALGRVIGWPDFGAKIYIYDEASDSCTTQTIPGSAASDSAHSGPAPDSNGTFGRFQYFPDAGVFVLLNDWNIDVHLLRLAAAKSAAAAGNVRK
jgi:hypothetical protein